MPYKKGPNGTLRYYDSSTGKYCNDPAFSIKPTIHKKSVEQKEKERREILEHLAQKSKDAHLYEIYSLLEKIHPGTTRHINSVYFDKTTRKQRELDIITSKAIYEIKSGKRGRHLKQFLSQMEIAKNLGKDHVVYSPGITDYQVKHLRKIGIKAYNKIKDLEEMEKNRK